jgi:hypothetical protein
LKAGGLEHYLGISKKGLTETIAFCKAQLTAFLANDGSAESKEIRNIIDQIIT